MSETVNIAALAESASDKVFSAFGWQKDQIHDETFPCAKVEKHQTKGAGGVHPVDCVFSYLDPFSSKSIFLLCDLKSYARSTIRTTDFGPYIRGLAKSIECAGINNIWRTRYIGSDVNDWKIDGLLFVYNHDQEYDSDFKTKAQGLTPSSLPHSRDTRVHLLTPDDISYLQSVVADIKICCTEQGLDYKSRKFFYPQQLIHTPGSGLMPVAIIEMLRGKLIITALEDQASRKPRFFAYLRGEGSIPEFEYLVTYLHRHGIMSLTEFVEIKGASFGPDAQTHFDVAKDNFWNRHYKMPAINDSLSHIKFGRVDRIRTNFSSIDESKRRSK